MEGGKIGEGFLPSFPSPETPLFSSFQTRRPGTPQWLSCSAQVSSGQVGMNGFSPLDLSCLPSQPPHPGNHNDLRLIQCLPHRQWKTILGGRLLAGEQPPALPRVASPVPGSWGRTFNVWDVGRKT